MLNTIFPPHSKKVHIKAHNNAKHWENKQAFLKFPVVFLYVEMIKKTAEEILMCVAKKNYARF